MKRPFVVLALMSALVACTVPPTEIQPVPITPSNEVAGATVVRRPVPEPAVSAAPLTLPELAAPRSPIVVPSGTQYVCVSESNGQRQQTAIQFSKKVADLCRRHPEMGPCKYERDICRRSNGRVYATNGIEITKQTEAEYDRKVMRFVFKSN
jgi:hypothetical protein